MVRIISQNFVGNILDVGSYVTTYNTTGNIIISEARKDDEIIYWTQGYKLKTGAITDGNNQQIGFIDTPEILHDKELSHESNNPPTTFMLKYILKLTKDVADNTSIRIYYEGQSNTSMSKVGYTIDFWIKEGANKENTLLVTPVNIPPRKLHQEVTSINMVYSNVNFTEGVWDGYKRTVVTVQNGQPLPMGTLFEVEFPKEHLEVTNEVRVGKIYEARSQAYTTAVSKVNSHNVFQKDPNPINFEVVSVDGNKVVFKNLRATEPSNKYLINLGGDVWVKSLETVYNLKNTSFEGSVKGDVKNSSGVSISNSASKTYEFRYVVTKNNSSADVPYKERVEEPKPPQPTPKPVEEKPTPKPQPIEAPPCLDCDVCESCKCEPAEILGSNTEYQMTTKLTELYGVICGIANANCLDLPRLMAKFAFLLWCLLNDIVNQIIELKKLHGK